MIVEEYTNNFDINKNVKSIFKYSNENESVVSKITVVIPTYNHMGSFKQALDSCKNQIFKDFCVIVSEDNPDTKVQDKHLEIIKQFKNLNIKYYVNERNLGLFGNWNRCIELSQTELIVYLHDDDILLPECLEELYLLHLKNKNYSILINHIDVDEDLNPLSQTSIKKKLLDVSFLDVFMGQFISTGCGCLFLKSQLQKVGGYYEQYYPTADWIMIFKLIKSFGLKYYSKPLAYYRVSVQNTSAKVYSVYAENLNSYRNEIKTYIKLPKRLMNSLLDIRYKSDIYAIRKRWMNDYGAILELTFKQRIINKIFMGKSKLKLFI